MTGLAGLGGSALADSVEPITGPEFLLGEGPVWSVREQTLYWVDIKANAIHRRADETGERRAWRLPAEVGSMALRTSGGAVVALRTGLQLFDFESGQTTPICDPERDLPTNRFNDGKCDRRGRFWAGTLEDQENDPLGSLYRLDRDHRCRRMLGGITCSNGLGWSPDGQTMYFTDTWTHRIDSFEFDPDSGELGLRRPFTVDLPGTGVPDGLTIDSEGGVWSAKWDGWRLVRYQADGKIDRVIRLPVPRPTSCVFGGRHLDELYVTSARWGLDDATIRQAPLSGSLFRLDVGIRGIPEPEFAG